jgi:hypothetical protein
MRLDPAMVAFARLWAPTVRPLLTGGTMSLSHWAALPDLKTAVRQGLLRDLGDDDSLCREFAAGPHLGVYLAAAALTRRTA